MPHLAKLPSQCGAAVDIIDTVCAFSDATFMSVMRTLSESNRFTILRNAGLR
jgi:hypothetical protein